MRLALMNQAQFYVEKEDYETVEDVHAITSDFLIRHIDTQFELYESLPWKEHITFSDFLEYLLPYRIDCEPLEYIMKADLRRKFISPEDSVRYFKSDVNFKDKFFPIDYYYEYTNEAKHIGIMMSTPNYPFPISGRWPLSCYFNAFSDLMRYKIMGIPAAYDYVPAWANENTNHAWATRYAHLGVTNDLTIHEYSKVYRLTYSANHRKDVQDTDNLPSHLTSPFIKDVTDLFTETSDVEVVLHQHNGIKGRNVMVGVFNRQQWYPVAYGEKKGKYATFTKLNDHCIHIPMIFENNQVKYLGYPFVTGNNSYTQFIPDFENTMDITFKRKTKLDDRKREWCDKLVGMEVHASNDPDFKDYQVVAVIGSPSYDAAYWLDVETDEKFRYWRVYKSTNPRAIISGLYFSDKTGEELQGHIIHPEYEYVENYDKSGRVEPTLRKLLVSDKGPIYPATYDVINDRNRLTFLLLMSWVGYDFGRPVSVGEVMVIPQNDDNYVCPGQMYELKYMTLDGWVSHGAKIADSYEVTFNDVPSNAVYWLRNITKGKEEQIFIIRDGEAVFIEGQTRERSRLRNSRQP